MGEYTVHLVDKTGGSITNANPLPIAGSIAATTTATATAAAPSYVEGTASPISQDLTGNLRVAATVNASVAATAHNAASSFSEGTSNGLVATLTGALRVFLENASIAVTGTFWQATQPVSGTVTANLGTIAGVSTAAKQPALGTAGSASADVITVQGIASMTALKVDASATTQPVSGTVTANAGTGTFTAGGVAASGATASGNPLLSGGRAATTNPTAVTDGQAVAAMLDILGKAVSVLNAPRALKGVATASTTGNTAITLIAAGAAGVYNDIEALWFDNTSATGTDVTLSDGTNSHHFYVPPTDTRGLSIPTMLIAASTATAWQITSSASVTTLYASATFAKRTG